VDAPSDEENDSDKNNNTADKQLPSRVDEQQEHHACTPKGLQTEAKLSGAEASKTYKPHQRNPLYSGAENSCLWELNRLSRHYHPSVCLFVSTLMKVIFMCFAYTLERYYMHGRFFRGARN